MSENWQAADGTGQPSEVLPTKATNTADVSRDGTFLVYADVGADLTSTSGDVFPDGKRFVLLAQVQDTQAPTTPTITVVQNWFAEFRGRHAAGR